MAALVTLAVCQLPADFEKFSKACLDEAKVSEDELKQFIQNGMNVNEATENIKCHTKCLMQKLGMWKDGVLDADAKAKELMQLPKYSGHDAEIIQIVNNCKNEKGANECDTVFNIAMCIKKSLSAQIA